MEKKRETFQRFYFLSNDELIEILSQAKNLKSVVHHLRKCFENINKLEFDNIGTVVAMLSAEGERAMLKNYIEKTEDVEVWFKDLEDAMKNSLKSICKSALVSYDAADMSRSNWIL